MARTEKTADANEIRRRLRFAIDAVNECEKFLGSGCFSDEAKIKIEALCELDSCFAPWDDDDKNDGVTTEKGVENVISDIRDVVDRGTYKSRERLSFDYKVGRAMQRWCTHNIVPELLDGTQMRENEDLKNCAKYLFNND